jgi:cysteine synthase B
MTYRTIDAVIGNTSLVELVRLPDETIRARNNVILGKLEGNSPAGSVKDRAALSMIRWAERRARIRPVVLLMPEDVSEKRRRSMAAYGAEIILTPAKGGMECARDMAAQMEQEGGGIVLD